DVPSASCLRTHPVRAPTRLDGAARGPPPPRSHAAAGLHGLPRAPEPEAEQQGLGRGTADERTQPRPRFPCADRHVSCGVENPSASAGEPAPAQLPFDHAGLRTPGVFLTGSVLGRLHPRDRPRSVHLPVTEASSGPCPLRANSFKSARRFIATPRADPSPHLERIRRRTPTLRLRRTPTLLLRLPLVQAGARIYRRTPALRLRSPLNQGGAQIRNRRRFHI